MFEVPTIKQVKGENVWVTYAKKQMFKKNCSLNLVVTGKPGSSKSWSLLSYVSQVDPDFNMDYCYFKASELLRDIKNKERPRGSAFMFDECGIDLNNLNWQNEICRSLNLLFQTVRFKNYTIGLTLPFLSFLSKGVRTLMTAQFEAIGWNKKDMTSKIKPLVLEYNGDMDKFYKKRLLVKNPNGNFTYCNFMKLPAPAKKLTIEYEKRKKEYTDTLYNSIANKVESFEKESLKIPTKYTLTDHQQKVVDLLKQGMLIDSITNVMSCSKEAVYACLESIKKKGVIITPIKENNRVLRYEIT